MLILTFYLAIQGSLRGAVAIPAEGSKLPPAAQDKVITQQDVTNAVLGLSIHPSAIGEPVSGVTLSAPNWTGWTNGYAAVDGSLLPVDPNAKRINFRVVLPAQWSRRAAQLGGAGVDGIIPNLNRSDLLSRGFALYGSDSGHQMGGFPGVGPRRGGGFPMGGGDGWATNDEAIKNLGYMQMKKTHDAVMIILKRVYGELPRFNYFFGSSQGGREALTVAQRYPADYDGIVADVPILNFSSLMLAPELIRIQEKPLNNWVTHAKVNAIRAEFLRQADKLDGLEDGIINNYMAARALFDMSEGTPDRNPWAALRGTNGVDPDPTDNSTNAKLSDGQISTLKFIYSRYYFKTPLANGVTWFGMWVPNIDPAGNGLIAESRFLGQEGASENAQRHFHLGILGVTGFLMQNLQANPLDYVEGGPLNARRIQLSDWLDATKPDLSDFYHRGGKLIITVGTGDTLASPGAQLDYFQSVLDKMGRDIVDAFARFYVIPQAGHGLNGSSASINGAGQVIPVTPIPSQFNKTSYIMAWVEENKAPGKTLVVRTGDRSLPLCSYPNYPKYIGGPPESADSYVSTAP